MDLGAPPVSPAQGRGLASGPAAAWSVVRAVAQAMLLPWNVFNWMAAGVSRLVDEARLAGSGADRMLAPPGAAGASELTISGAGNAGAGTTLTKEKAMSDDRCGVTDCQIRLFQYTIVSIKRGRSRILYSGKKLVTDPMDQCDFDAWVIAEYLQSPAYQALPPDEKIDEYDKRYLRVSSELMQTWEKQPLHYEEKQLALLERIADGIAPPAN